MLALCSHSLQEMRHRQSGKGQLMTADCWIHSQSFFLLSPPGCKYALGYKRQLLSVECLRGKNILCFPARLRRETSLFSHIKQGKRGGTCASSVLPHRAFQERWNKLPKNQEICPTNGKMEGGRGVVLKANRHCYLQKATGERYFNKYMQKKQHEGVQTEFHC